MNAHLIDTKVTKTAIRNYVFNNNFSSFDNGLTDDDVNYLYKTIEGIEHSNLTNKIRKSHKKYYSNKEKTIFVNIVFDILNRKLPS